jgi:hypothetical protein
MDLDENNKSQGEVEMIKILKNPEIQDKLQAKFPNVEIYTEFPMQVSETLKKTNFSWAYEVFAHERSKLNNEPWHFYDFDLNS